MPKKKKKKEEPRMYKGYDIKWLRGLNNDHPDYKLVAEYEEKYGDAK